MLVNYKSNHIVAAIHNIIRRNLRTPISCKFLLKFTHKLLVAIKQKSPLFLKVKFFPFRGIIRPNRTYETLDPRIKNLVETMNATGQIITVASCEGHGIRSFRPYVYFEATVSVASAINKKLRDDYLLKNGRLHYYWQITGVFNKESSLMFLLESPELNDACNSHLLCLIKFFLFRKKLDKDFLALEALFFEYAKGIGKREEISIN